MTDWEQQYLDGETPWDKGSPAPPLVEWLEKNPETMNGHVIAPGCGLGHDVRAIAGATSADVLGLDLSETAVSRANEMPVVNDELYRAADLFDLPADLLDAFDWVWEHTCFCAIDPDRRDDYVAAVAGVLKPGGQLLGVFYLDPYDDEHQPGEGPPHGTTVAEITERFVTNGPFELVWEWAPSSSYPGREGLERMVHLQKRA